MKRFGTTTKLFAVVFIVFGMTGCGTLQNDRKWGQDAVYPVDLTEG